MKLVAAVKLVAADMHGITNFVKVIIRTRLFRLFGGFGFRSSNGLFPLHDDSGHEHHDGHT